MSYNTIMAQSNGNLNPDSRLSELKDAIHELLQEWDRYVDDPDSEPAPKPRITRCPCTSPTPHKHGDANPSLSISLFLPDGANPEKKDAWGLYVRCLAGHGHDNNVLADEAGDAILAAFGEWKGISLQTLKRAGVQVDLNEKNRVSVRFVYRDGSVHVRRLPKAWTWENGKNSNEKLYDWLEVPTQDYCILVEGESDTLVLADAGFNVIGRTNVNALMSADKRFRELSAKYKTIYISVEDDQESNQEELQNKLQTLQQKSAGAEIRVIHWANHGVKDPSELRVGLAHRDRFVQTIMTAMQNAERVVVQPKPSKSTRSIVLTGSLSQQLQQLFIKYAYSPNLSEIARRLVRSVLTDDFKFICVSRRELEGYLRVWDGERKLWTETNEALHMDWVRDSVRERLSQCQPNSDEESRALKEISSLLGVERTITLAFKEAVQDIYTDEHAFILGREYVPCQNTLLCVEESGDIIEQELDRAYPITWQLNTIYDPTADAPLWREHLMKVCNGEPELVRELLRLGGLAISGYRSRYIYWLHGGGRNGKTTTIGVFAALLGPRMAMSLPANAFAARKEGDAEPYLWGARHARIIVVNETPDRADLDIEKLKALTDDNADTNRAIRGVFMNLPEEFIWKPQFALIFTSNRKPVLPHKTDQAFYDRLRLLPFGYRFNESEMRPNYSAALLQESPGILNTLLWGLADYLRYPHWLSKPAYIAVQDRRMDEDAVYAWFRESCVPTFNRGDRVSKDDLWTDFMEWCEANSLADEWKGKDRRFTEQLKQILLGIGINNPYDRHLQQDGKRGWFCGLRFKTPQDPDQTPKHVGRDAVVDMVESWLRGETELQTIEYEPDWTAVDAQHNPEGRRDSGGRRDFNARMHDLTIFSDKSKKFQNSNSNWNAQKFPNLSEIGSRSCIRAENHVAFENHVAPVEVFLRECCDVGQDFAEQFDTLYSEYVEWCRQCGQEPDTSNGFGRTLTDMGFPTERRGKHRVTYRTGLRLKPEREPVSIDPDALKQALDALAAVGLDERAVRLLHRMIVRWEQERVVYEDTAHERLSAFVADFKTRSGLTKIPDMVAQWLLLAWFVSGRGCEHVGDNGDTVVLGARLRDENDPQPDEGGHGLEDTPPQPCPPTTEAADPDTYICVSSVPADAPPELELRAEEPKKKSRRKQDHAQTLDALDYSVSPTDNIQPIKERLPMTTTTLEQPTYELPNIQIPEPRPFSELNCVALDIETTSLDPNTGMILAIGWKDREREHIWRLPDSCREPIRKLLAGETLSYEENDLLDMWESKLLRRFLSALEQSKPGLLTGYNLFDFDLPFIIGRCERLGVAHPFTIWDYSMRVAGTRGTFKSDTDLEFVPVFLPRDWNTAIADMFHLVCRFDFAARKLSGYDLKTAAGEIAGRQRLVTLSHDNIHDAFLHDSAMFDQYLTDDLRDTWALLEKLAPAYYYISNILEYPLWKVFVAGNATLWNHLLCSLYHVERETAERMADPKREYAGGLVAAQTGAFVQCHKIDVSSLYPSIMLQYDVHSRKDTERYSLAYLKRFTEERLRLKALAKKGDKEAEYLQGAYKILINSLYGFLGTAGVAFNDMDAAERVTTIGRELLTRMIHALEDGGYHICEADTDGIIFCGPDAERGLEIAQSALPEGFKLELDWQDKCVFVSARKNYIIYNPDGSVYDRKGGVYRSRDRNKLNKECMVEFIRRLVFDGADAAKAYALDIYHRIVSGRAWDLVVERRRVSVKQSNTQFYRQALATGYKDNDKVACAYANGGYSFRPEDGYDADRYAKDWVDMVKSIIALTRNRQVSITNESGVENNDAVGP